MTYAEQQRQYQIALEYRRTAEDLYGHLVSFDEDLAELTVDFLTDDLALAERWFVEHS